MEVVLTVVITLAILVVFMTCGDVINALLRMVLGGVLALLLTGLTALVAWTIVHAVLS